MDVLQGIALISATITMGIAAGVYALYAFAVMPGLARTDDRTFVGAFQQIDTAIVGPFLLVFFVGPLGLAAWAATLHLGRGDDTAFALVTAAVGLQSVMALITLTVNVPLNNRIKGAGDPDRIAELALVRQQFNEARWVRWNKVRALAATVAFGLLVWAVVLYGAS